MAKVDCDKLSETAAEYAELNGGSDKLDFWQDVAATVGIVTMVISAANSRLARRAFTRLSKGMARVGNEKALPVFKRIFSGVKGSAAKSLARLKTWSIASKAPKTFVSSIAKIESGLATKSGRFGKKLTEFESRGGFKGRTPNTTAKNLRNLRRFSKLLKFTRVIGIVSFFAEIGLWVADMFDDSDVVKQKSREDAIEMTTEQLAASNEVMVEAIAELSESDDSTSMPQDLFEEIMEGVAILCNRKNASRISLDSDPDVAVRSLLFLLDQVQAHVDDDETSKKLGVLIATAGVNLATDTPYTIFTKDFSNNRDPFYCTQDDGMIMAAVESVGALFENMSDGLGIYSVYDAVELAARGNDNAPLTLLDKFTSGSCVRRWKY